MSKRDNPLVTNVTRQFHIPLLWPHFHAAQALAGSWRRGHGGRSNGLAGGGHGLWSWASRTDGGHCLWSWTRPSREWNRSFLEANMPKNPRARWSIDIPRVLSWVDDVITWKAKSNDNHSGCRLFMLCQRWQSFLAACHKSLTNVLQIGTLLMKRQLCSQEQGLMPWRHDLLPRRTDFPKLLIRLQQLCFKRF